MLRVTRSAAAGKTCFKLEGKLAGSWVDVVEECWRQAVAEGVPAPMAVDLSAITYVDGRGTDLLLQMHNSGVELAATTCLGKGIVEQIRSCSEEPAGNRH
jgi:anti-anti-sigma regulatory factor